MKAGSSEAKKKESVTLAYAIEDYLDLAKNLKGFSDTTISSYGSDFKQFHEFLTKKGSDTTDISTITPADIEDFCLALKNERHLCVNSIHRKKDSLSSLLKHAVKRKWVDDNPVESVEIERKKKSVRNVFLDWQQTKKFIIADARVKGYSPPTLRAVRMTLCFAGARNSEIRKLDWENIDFSLSLIRIFNSKNTDLKCNPDGLDRSIPICTHLRDALLEIRSDTGPVFRNIRGTRLTKDAMKSLVARSAKYIESKTPITPHCLRHSLSSNLEKIGATRSDIALILGHSPGTVTDGYVHSSQERIAELIENFSLNVMKEKLNENAEKNEDGFSCQQSGGFNTQIKNLSPNFDIQERKRRDIVIDIEKVSEAERVWNEIHGEKPMPASFLLGYAFRP
jgi:site-specific recombinase XerD